MNADIKMSGRTILRTQVVKNTIFHYFNAKNAAVAISYELAHHVLEKKLPVLCNKVSRILDTDKT